ncbi:glycosyltransferase [Cellulomonas fengjieae]|uniref:Glycosyltransferase n=1 Tax=Cellulomonas fengjieae TaxID=2819978 RepID=A0ABS3SDM7_9CELL|nr:glycosyltransferase [Cellulomonas fengjieae]MBO3083845.1 glycosyltransferase [Cellulomonas fengjieae]MBO3101406.1 glycosyltransferase [Cellulomonas fengjieae]QVI64869.1 glycosyltransferase [Cellulomonas fengjieae]
MRSAEPEIRPGVVSVVLVNYRGADDTITCLGHLLEMDWPADLLELLVVDNDSGDDSVARIRAAVPQATVIPAGSNTGFAGGCNLGVAHATGEYVAFLNNDARPDRLWVAAAVETLRSDERIGAIASKVLDWDGKVVDYVDGSLTWYGMGYKREVGRADSAEFDVPKDVLFATGAATVMPTAVFRAVGGFDERFFMFYEDVDLGWRLNLLGYRVRYEPRSLAFHKHHVTMKKFGSFRESYLLERNALMSMYKNMDDETLAKALPGAMALAVRRSLARADVDATTLDLQRSPGGDDEGDVVLPKMALTGVYAIDYFTDNLASLTETRQELQALRRRTDRELFPLFRHAIEPAYGFPSYLSAHRDVVAAFGLAEHFISRQRVLVVTGEPLLERMAGPAIRAWEIARALAPEHDVRLVSTGGCQVSSDAFSTSYASGRALDDACEWADVIIFQGFLLEAAPWLKKSSKILVADVYDPMHLEQLEQARDLGTGGRALAVRETTRVLNEQLRRADFLLCASDKQRDFWLGQLAGQGRINPALYDEDASLDALIAVVPFGIPDEPPVRTASAIRGVVDGIGADDKVILWGGGVYNWFDPLTLLRAVHRLSVAHPDVRLYFMGLKHPNPGVPDMRMAWETQQLAEELGLTNKHVFFNHGWVPYAQRANYLLDADVGVSTHFLHIETAFSFRTRILDYLWASLPIVATDGDTFGELIRDHGLGRVVPERDVDALVAALEEMLYDEDASAEAAERVAEFRSRYTWSVSLQPLVEFCRFPRRAADLAVRLGEPTPRASVFRRQRPSIRDDVALAKQYMSAGGAREVVRRAAGRVRRVVGRAEDEI